MTPNQISLISGVIVMASAIPYLVRVWQGISNPGPTSFGLWSLINLALLVTYQDNGATASVWPALFSFINLTAITVILVWRRRESWTKPEWWQMVSIVVCLLTVAVWLYARTDERLKPWAFYLSIAADTAPTAAQFVYFLKYPQEDRPGLWLAYTIGYGLSIFAVTTDHVIDYLLPVYVTATNLLILSPMVVYRLRRGLLWKEFV